MLCLRSWVDPCGFEIRGYSFFDRRKSGDAKEAASRIYLVRMEA